MSVDRVHDTHCEVCRRQMTTMKRCTRCNYTVYCSRACQIKDWPQHQVHCGTDKVRDAKPKSYKDNDRSIFDEDEPNNSAKGPAYHPLVDFSKAIKQTKDTQFKPEGKSYLFKDEFYTDIPELNESEPKSNIVVKCNKDKHKLCVQQTWSGSELFRFLAYSLKVPLEKVKIIHKGKVLSEKTISDTIKDKAVYQVLGETLEDEGGVDQRDIAVMMKQMGVGRNKAVQTLKKKGDLIDALLD